MDTACNYVSNSSLAPLLVKSLSLLEVSGIFNQNTLRTNKSIDIKGVISIMVLNVSRSNHCLLINQTLQEDIQSSKALAFSRQKKKTATLFSDKIRKFSVVVEY